MSRYRKTSIFVFFLSSFLGLYFLKNKTKNGLKPLIQRANPTTNSDALAQVFETTVKEDLSSISAQQPLSHKWFETAENIPKLWSQLDLNRKIHFTDPEYVRLHLQNAVGIPLDITINLPDDLPYDADIPVIAELRKVVHKIKSLTIDMPFHEAWQKFVSGIGDGQPAPILERLVLRVKGDVEDVTKNGPFTILSTALTPSPNLVHLQLPAWPFPAQPPPQLSTVTSLVFDTPFTGLYIPALFSLIKTVPHLQHFTFKAVDMGDESSPNYSNIISLPQLRTVDVTTPGYGLDFLRNFHAPLLTEVRLDGYREEVSAWAWEQDDWGIHIARPASNILAHLSAHSPNIRRLELTYVQFEHPKEDHIRLLSGQALPVLEELILERTNIPDAALIESAGRYPGLKRLELHECKHISADGLRKFVQGHMNAEFVLRVERCPGITEEDVESLSKIVRVEISSR